MEDYLATIKTRVYNHEMDKITAEDVNFIKKEETRKNKTLLIITIIWTILSIVILVLSLGFNIAMPSFIAYFAGAIFIVIPLYLFLFFNYKESIKVYDRMINYINGKSVFNPYILSKDKFINELNYGGLMALCFVLLEGKVFYVEAFYENKNFVGYINGNKFLSGEDFMNFELINGIKFNDLDNISIIEYNTNDPKVYFEEKTI